MSEAVLVTGGAGYIGSHVCKAVAASGRTPVTLDNLVHGHEWAVQWGPLEICDLLDGDKIRDIIVQHKISAAIHMAGYAYVGESVTNPSKYYENNFIGSLSLCDALVAEGVKNIVFSSSCAVYGVPSSVPIDESEQTAPINPYGASKLFVERLLADFDVAHGLGSVCLRYFNAAGADPDCEIGEVHVPETHLIPLTLEVAAGTSDHMEIYGDDYETTDGTCIRDYVHVADLADAHVKALDYLISGSDSAIFNLGIGNGYSVREVIETAEKVTGRSIPVKIADRRPGDPPSLVADPAKAEKMLGWKAKLSSLEDQIEHAWNWRSRQDWPHLRDGDS